ncbi:putative F-box protein At3g16210 isoform X2 [Salvia hispanica]|uniref:putative F-box protein At3g16210 isoform X2 n=1 Tax=Salvia hispanica TaxID=49212 RepID=UPI002009909F|nr:putative F-box protein At3g16210 isoform X2 [Salvia hispanica]
MEQDLFRNLPSDTIIHILLRLTPKNISTCKCVCKTWLNLIESDNFHKSHPLVVVVSMPAKDSNRFNVFKLEDEHKEDLFTKFNFPRASTIQGSANGLLLLKDDHKDLYVCNPFTRDFVELRGPPTSPLWGDYYGFGVSKITGQHKIVCHNVKTGFQVYALEAGSLWRGVEAANPSFDRCYTSVGAYVSGNLHWLVSNRRGIPYVCCFDLETERFSTFSVPPKSVGIKGRNMNKRRNVGSRS